MDFLVEFQPWSRAQESVSEGKNLFILPLGRIDEREEHFVWISEIIDYDISFLSTDGVSHTLESAKSLENVMVQQGTTFEEFLFANGFTNVCGSPDTKANAEMLYNDRGQAWLIPEWEGLWIWNHKGFDQEINLGPPVMNTIAWLAASKDSDPALIDTVSTALEEVLEENLLEAIVATYTQPNEESEEQE
ncbi:type 2 periplasmic-binding domain-containing protein [Tindallia californiensis]|uniref:Extracellular solute-binding protein, family 3 n=1 Tax=Tindallia californiensis TaxID=159292 RepID=A0A1H3QSQ6_9FIRM|nr:transporter substrate-binding domain-containing protein [Tindallia californiensis]SDZ16091.1 extracellular solute-binding protein, family 3 [Tindallia californiensis]